MKLTPDESLLSRFLVGSKVGLQGADWPLLSWSIVFWERQTLTAGNKTQSKGSVAMGAGTKPEALPGMGGGGGGVLDFTSIL